MEHLGSRPHHDQTDDFRLMRCDPVCSAVSYPGRGDVRLTAEFGCKPGDAITAGRPPRLGAPMDGRETLPVATSVRRRPDRAGPMHGIMGCGAPSAVSL